MKQKHSGPIDTNSSFSRREVLGAALKFTTVAAVNSGLMACVAPRFQASNSLLSGPSAFGYWRQNEGLPEFVYTADQSQMAEARWDPLERPVTDRHFHMMGNRALQMQASNTGDVALFDESEGMRWLIYGDDSSGTGHSLILDTDGLAWGSSWSERPPNSVPERIFGVNYFKVSAGFNGLTLSRNLLVPDGEVPWVLIRVDLSLAADASPRSIVHREQWALRPRFLKTWQSDFDRDIVAREVTYDIRLSKTKISARELFAISSNLNGSPALLELQALEPMTAESRFSIEDGQGDHPMLLASTNLTIQPGTTKTLWFRFGRAASTSAVHAENLFQESQDLVRRRLPKAASLLVPSAQIEIPWHAAVLTGGASRDHILPGHTLNQASIYGYGLGANAAARDALQHALPLIYSEPDLALSVLKNTCAWAAPNGDLPFALSDDKSPITDLLRPSDQNLWALWLASEYAAVSGNLRAFDEPQPFHPKWDIPPVTLKEHLIRQFRFFVDTVGRGAQGHVRILNADWNDMVLGTPGIDRQAMIENGGSVLNSAMGSWVLSIFAGLMSRLGEQDVAEEARVIASDLKERVAMSWNGRWVDRAYSPNGEIIGRETCWLEVQPWAILCGAISGEQAKNLLNLIDSWHRSGSPLGARIVWPPDMSQNTVGQGTKGGIWYSINMTLMWAAARINPEMAWDEWRRLSLDGHVRAYPTIWEGTLSGPDAWNAPESNRPGRTWTSANFSQQAFPVNNLHAHSQPILAYLRLLGVEPNQAGGLDIMPTAVASGSSFQSSTFSLRGDGTGWIEALGPISLRTRTSQISGLNGRVSF